MGWVLRTLTAPFQDQTITWALLSFSTKDPTIGALIIRIGFGVYYTIVLLRNPQKSVGNSLGPYMTLHEEWRLNPFTTDRGPTTPETLNVEPP